MKIAVLMSTYNGEKYIRQQVDSILNQSISGIELIVRDDGSTDGTIDILNSYHNNLKWYKGSNIRSARSFMELLINCGEYDYYSFADQDDIWDTNKLSVAIEMLSKYDAPAYYYCNSRLVDSNGNACNVLTYKQTNSNNPIIQKKGLNNLCCSRAMGCTMVLNKKLVECIRTYGYPEKMIMHDSYIQAVCTAISGMAIYDSDAHMDYRQHDKNVVGRKAGVKSAIAYRWNYLREKKEVSIADQARDIWERYRELISKESKDDLELVSSYCNSLSCRIKLAMTRKLIFSSFKDAVFVRVSILLGAR